MIVYGKQVIFYIIEKHRNLIEEVYLAKELDKKTFSIFANLGVKIIKLDERKAQSLAQGGNHQGFLLKIKEFEFCSIDELKSKSFIVFLDEITDVGNIGAIARSAYALGAGAVVVSGINEIKMNNIIRTSSGAALDIPVYNCLGALDLLNDLKMSSYELICADMNGENLSNFVKSDSKKVLILGSEGKGVNKKILQRTNKQVRIEMKNSFDSLNVSAAAAILIYGLI